VATTFDAASSGNYGGPSAGTTSGTQAHTVTATGGNRLLVATVQIRGATAVSAVTYNGVALTLLTRNTGSTVVRTEIWYLVAPATGTHNVVLTMPSAEIFDIVASSWTNVDPVTPFGTPAGATSTSTAPSVVVTGGAANGAIVDSLAFQASATNTSTPGAGQTSIGTNVTGLTTANVAAASSREAGASSVTMSYTLSVSRVWAITAVPVNNLDFANTATANDTVTISDAATRTTAGAARTGTDTVIVADAAARTASATRTVADSVAISDATTRTSSVARASSDTLTITDAASRSATSGARAAADAVSVADVASRASTSAARSTVDTFAVSDAMKRSVSWARTATDGWSVSDAATVPGIPQRSASDSFSVADAATRAGSYARTGADSWAVSDTAAATTPGANGLFLRRAGAWTAVTLQRREAGIWVTRALTVL
jgi:hypothetical protein